MSDSQFRVLSDSNIFKQAQASDDTRLDVVEAQLDLLKGQGVYTSLDSLKTAKVGNNPYLLITDNIASQYQYVTGDFTNAIDNDVFIELQNTAKNIGCLRKSDGNLYARDFGVVGNARIVNGVLVGIDDTVAIRNFLALCARLQKIAYFGNLKCKVSGPLVLNSTGMVFDGQGYATNDPGLYPVGNGYTVLTVRGIIADLRVGVYGTGDVILDSTNTIISDTRPNVTGVQLSGRQDQAEVVALSKISYVRVWNLPRGILIKGMWDTNMEKLSVEYCGGANEPDWAIDIQDGGFPGQTTNECIVHYIQSEHSYNRALRITPNLLSTGFGKIHSERAFCKTGVITWQLGGGSCTYENVRLDGSNPNAINGVCSVSGAATKYTTLRGENLVFEYSALTGATIGFYECTGAFRPSFNQNGNVNFFGGDLSLVDVDGYTSVYGSTISTMACGFCEPARKTVVINCVINDLIATSTSASIEITNSIAKIRPINGFGMIKLLNATQLRPTSGTTIRLAYQRMLVDVSSSIIADVVTDFGGLELYGSIQGGLTITGPAMVIAGADSRLTGGSSGFSMPLSDTYIGTSTDGRYCKNLAVDVGQPTGWIYSKGAWKPLALLA